MIQWDSDYNLVLTPGDADLVGAFPDSLFVSGFATKVDAHRLAAPDDALGDAPDGATGRASSAALRLAHTRAWHLAHENQERAARLT